MSMTRAMIARGRVWELKALTKENVITALERAIDSPNGYAHLKIKISDDALDHIAWASAGDIRTALNALELAVKTTPENKKGEIVIDKSVAEDCVQSKAIALDETTQYDMLSAFCKSLRGSDSDAALFYAQKLLVSGYDPLIIARRLVAHASEDVGMADSNALLLAISALNSCEKVGYPECNLTLCHAIIYLCEAEKSNSVVVAMNNAQKDAIEFKDAVVPNHLKNHPTGYDDGHGKYKYPHNYGGYVAQQYLPDAVKDKVYYVPSNNGREKGLVKKKDKYNK